MAKKRHRHTAAYKLQVALKTLEGKSDGQPAFAFTRDSRQPDAGRETASPQDEPRVSYNHERPHKSPDHRTQVAEHFVSCSELAESA